MDFYDFHPYTATVERFEQVMKVFDDKPLIFGEWGGWWCRNNEGLLHIFGDSFARAAAFRDGDADHLNGIAYWEWADMRQYGRGLPGCEKGILSEGLVTEGREKKPDYYAMRDIFQKIVAGPHPEVELLPSVRVPSELRAYRPKGAFRCVDRGHPLSTSGGCGETDRADPRDPAGNYRDWTAIVGPALSGSCIDRQLSGKRGFW